MTQSAVLPDRERRYNDWVHACLLLLGVVEQVSIPPCPGAVMGYDRRRMWSDEGREGGGPPHPSTVGKYYSRDAVVAVQVAPVVRACALNKSRLERNPTSSRNFWQTTKVRGSA